MAHKILVTGHKGYIGTHLMKRLEAVGIDLKDGNDILNCELPDAEVVFHLAAQPGVIKSMKDPFETVRTNTLGVVRLAEKYKYSRFIFASTGGAIQEEIISPYGLSKYCAEEFVKMLYKNYAILRFANVYGGEGSRSVVDKFINDDEITVYGDGQQTRTFVHINDLINGLIHSMSWGVGSFHFGSHQNYKILDLALATKKKITFEPSRAGELFTSELHNTTPDWEPTIDVMDYVRSSCCQ